MAYGIFLFVGCVAERFLQIVRKEQAIVAESVRSGFLGKNSSACFAVSENVRTVGAVQAYRTAELCRSVCRAVKFFKQRRTICLVVAVDS